MNKKRVEQYLPVAIEALEKCKIAENGKIEKTFRGNISSFGAAVSEGSFKTAVAFFSEKGGSSIDRHNLIKALWYVTQDREYKDPKDICKKIILMPDTGEIKAQFLDASIALKLAMNVYELDKEQKSDKDKTKDGETAKQTASDEETAEEENGAAEENDTAEE